MKNSYFAVYSLLPYSYFASCGTLDFVPTIWGQALQRVIKMLTYCALWFDHELALKKLTKHMTLYYNLQ
jgi:hypothetical protein